MKKIIKIKKELDYQEKLKNFTWPIVQAKIISTNRKNIKKIQNS